MAGERCAYIFFATLQLKRGRWWQLGLLRLARWLTLSKIIHCAVGYDGVVLNPTFGGNQYWPMSAFLATYPKLAAVVEVPLSHGINLSYFEYGVAVPKPWIPTVLRWLRGGAGPWTQDCVCMALACLIAGGVPVPPTITSPIELFRWLKKQGYSYGKISRACDPPGQQDADRLA